MRLGRVFAAETVGTTVLILVGPGSAVLATGRFFEGGSIGVLGVSLAFGFALLVMAYAIGNISGCHINPAVTLGLVIRRKITLAHAAVYWIAQLLGAAIGGGIISLIASGGPGNFNPNDSNFAVNGWGNLSPGGFDFMAMVVVEVVFTALLVFVVLSTMHHKFPAAAGGLAAGITLAMIHLATIPIDNTSVNPARSFAMAIYAGGDAPER